MKAQGPPLLTRRQLAKAMGVHMQTVTKWERSGLPIAKRGRKGKPSLYDETASRHWLAEREAAAQEAAAQAGGPSDVARERASKEHWQAMLAQQAHAARAGELVLAADVAREWANHIAAVRTKLLAWPATLADRLHRAGTLKGVAGVEQVLSEAVRDTLRELAGEADRAEESERTKRGRRAS